jgi:restriction endonuclease S subunit
LTSGSGRRVSLGDGVPTVPFGDVIRDIRVGESPRCLDRPPKPDEWGVLKVSAVRPARFIPTEAKALPPERTPKPSARFSAGDLLVTRSDTLDRVGAACVAQGDVSNLLLSDLIFRIRLDEAVLLPEFAARGLGWLPVRRQIEAAAVGTSGSMKKVNQSILRSLELPAPPIDEQRRIVDILDAVDDSVVACEEALRSSTILSEAKTAQLCPTSIVQSDGGVPIGALADYINGRAFKPSDFVEDGGLPVIRIKQLLNPSAPVDRFDGEYSEKHLIADGDIIFSWSATLAVERWQRGPALLNQHLFKVVPGNGVDPGWLMFVLRSALAHLKDMTHGTTMRHITRGELTKVFTKRPSLQEQRRFVATLEQLAEEAGLRTQQHSGLTDLRAALLTALLSGSHLIPESYDRLLSQDGAVRHLEPELV